MTKEQRHALANMNGWHMTTIMMALIAPTWASWTIILVIPPILVASYYHNKFVG